jgi:hypothetical protein
LEKLLQKGETFANVIFLEHFILKKSEFILGENKYKYSAKIVPKKITLTFQKDPKKCIQNLEF